MTNTNSEKVNKSESVLKEVLLEYESVVKAAKEMLVENNSKEFNSLIEKFLSESESKKESGKDKKQEPKKGEKIQESTMVQKPIGETMKEEVAVVAPATVNMKEASLAEVEAAFDNANSNDEFQVVRGNGQDATAAQDQNSGDGFDLMAIQGEIDEMMKEINNAEQMQQVEAPQQQAPAQSSNPVDRFKQIHEEMGKYLKEIDDMNADQQMMNEFHQKMSGMYGEGYRAQMDEAKVAELFDMFKKVQSGKANEPVNTFNGGGQQAAAAPVTENDAVVEAAPVVDEAHGVSLSHNKLVGQEVQPRLDYGKGYAEHRVRLALQKESIDKKMTALLKENLALTKQVNKTKTDLKEASEKAAKLKQLNEQFSTAVLKYRDQFKEMAVLNTNISYVNDILLNENFAITKADKDEMVSKFKKVSTINESEELHKKFVKQLSESKKSITESLEDKVASTIVEPSSKNVIEESMNSGDERVEKMLRLSGFSDKKIV